MNNLRNIWRDKTERQKNSWRLLAIVLCIIASGFVEAYTWVTLIGAIPACAIIYLEINDGKH